MRLKIRVLRVNNANNVKNVFFSKIIRQRRVDVNISDLFIGKTPFYYLQKNSACADAIHRQPILLSAIFF